MKKAFRIEVISAPPGEAPDAVRQEWVGLVLPIDPRSPWVREWKVASRGDGDPPQWIGYAVPAREAIEILGRKAPDAALWWRNNKPHLAAQGGTLIFPEYCCRPVGTEGEPDAPSAEVSALNERSAAWITDQYDWLEGRLPSRKTGAHRRLVLPTAEFFPERYSPDERSAVVVFERIKGLFAVAEWPLSLQAVEPEYGSVNELSNLGLFGYQSVSEFNADIDLTKNRIVYSKRLLADPNFMVAVFAHEISRCLVARVKPPGSPSKRDLARMVDVVTVSSGFGLFACNAALRVKHSESTASQGWSVSRFGNLSEEELSFALALFCQRNQIAISSILRFLRPTSEEILRDATRYLATRPPSGPKAFHF